jgi:hypothetical protein
MQAHETVCSHTRVYHASTMRAQCANAVDVLCLGRWRQCSEYPRCSPNVTAAFDDAARMFLMVWVGTA